MKRRDELIEQYDDAVFALLMDRYAEESGAELLTRFQEASDAGLVPEPEGHFDRRAMDLIGEEFRSRRRRAWLTGLLRGLLRLIFAVFYVLGLLLRTGWEWWQERRLCRHAAAPETASADEGEPSVFLTP